MTQALVSVPKSIRRGDVIDVRALIAHPMETGFRVDHEGKPVPRDLVQRIEARWGERVVFAATLNPSVSANPFVAFSMRVDGPGVLELRWTGDRGLSHREVVTLDVV